jgi:hypothetical protein
VGGGAQRGKAEQVKPTCLVGAVGFEPTTSCSQNLCLHFGQPGRPSDSNKIGGPDSSGVVLTVDFELDLNSSKLLGLLEEIASSDSSQVRSGSVFRGGPGPEIFSSEPGQRWEYS